MGALGRGGERLYLLVFGVVGAATALRWGLDPLFGGAKQFIAFYPAVAVAALVGGARVGLMATGLSVLAVALFFVEPRGRLLGGSLSDWVALGLFALAGGLMSWMAARVDRARRREAEALARIATSAERMDGMITDALNYSRSAQQELPLTKVDTAALLRGILDSYPELQPSGAHNLVWVFKAIPRHTDNSSVPPEPHRR